MNQVMDSTTGLSKLTDQVIASDLLIYAKAGVKCYASAITEAASPAVRGLLKKQLDEAISFEDQIGALVMRKGWYNAYSADKQIQMDLMQSQNTLDQISRLRA